MRIAELSRRGAPFGEIGRVEYIRTSGPASNRAPAPLLLANGLLDDERKTLSSDHPLYDLFAHTLEWQDTWSDSEHESFWTAALDLWPAERGAKSHTYALAYALVVAIEAGVDLEEFVERLSRHLREKPIKGQTAEMYTMRELQRVGAVRIAIQMVSAPRHFHPDSGRLPRVVTEEVIVPRLALANTVLDRYSKSGDASREIVAAAHRVVDDTHEDDRAQD